jgi:hypothetical protein
VNSFVFGSVDSCWEGEVLSVLESGSGGCRLSLGRGDPFVLVSGCAGFFSVRFLRVEVAMGVCFRPLVLFFAVGFLIRFLRSQCKKSFR